MNKKIKIYNKTPALEPSFKRLEDLIDDGMVEITIATPKGWKCERKGCTSDYFHSHGTYSSLLPNDTQRPTTD